jgi:hypothetical protein
LSEQQSLKLFLIFLNNNNTIKYQQLNTSFGYLKSLLNDEIMVKVCHSCITKHHKKINCF